MKMKKTFNRDEVVSRLKAGEKQFLQEYDLEGADLSHVNLSRFGLSNIDLRGANLSYADLSRANLFGADLSSANLSHADLSYSNLSDANLNDADLHSADLQCSNLDSTDLKNANFSYSNLYAAVLRNADLRDADLSCSNLDCANLRNAYLNNTYLSTAYLSGADLSQCKGLLDAADFMDSTFKKTSEGYIVYKIFELLYESPVTWKIKPGSIITENVNSDRTLMGSYGINVAPFNWCVKNIDIKDDTPIYKLLIRFEWLIDVVVPYNTDGRIRCGKAEIIEEVSR